MNFTREPIIETIITPKEGSKLLLRNTKKEGEDDYLVDSIEVVSFGQSIFYRSFERPKSFIVPVSDYEVVEVKETRLALKSATIERSIKIGGGKIAPQPLVESKPSDEGRSEKKKERRRSRRKRSSENIDAKEVAPEEVAPDSKEEKKRMNRLLPPPPTLISQTISKYREAIHPDVPPELDEESADEEKSAKKPAKKTEKKEAEKSEEPSAETPASAEEESDKSTSFWGLFS